MPGWWRRVHLVLLSTRFDESPADWSTWCHPVLARPFALCLRQGKQPAASSFDGSRGRADLGAIPAQGAQNGERRVVLARVRTVVVEPFERDELRARDFARRAPRLIQEVRIPRPDENQASDLPGPEVFGDRAFSQRCLPRSLERRRVVFEPTFPSRVWKPDAQNLSSARTRPSMPSLLDATSPW